MVPVLLLSKINNVDLIEILIYELGIILNQIIMSLKLMCNWNGASSLHDIHPNFLSLQLYEQEVSNVALPYYHSWLFTPLFGGVCPISQGHISAFISLHCLLAPVSYVF